MFMMKQQCAEIVYVVEIGIEKVAGYTEVMVAMSY